MNESVLLLLGVGALGMHLVGVFFPPLLLVLVALIAAGGSPKLAPRKPQLVSAIGALTQNLRESGVPRETFPLARPLSEQSLRLL